MKTFRGVAGISHEIKSFDIRHVPNKIIREDVKRSRVNLLAVYAISKSFLVEHAVSNSELVWRISSNSLTLLILQNEKTEEPLLVEFAWRDFEIWW